MSLFYSSNSHFVNPHKRGHGTYQIKIYPGFSEFKDDRVKPFSSGSGGGGTRKSITEFSKSSRKNFLKNIFSRSSYPSLFLTLTYPNKYPADSKEWKRHLDNFFRSFSDKFPNAWFFWKLEPQKRGAPHFHLIGDLGAEIKVSLLRAYVKLLWYRTCKTGDIKHLSAGTQVDFINDSIGKMRAYVCKYVGKAVTGHIYEKWQRPGRFWGILGRKNLPPPTYTIIDLNKKEFLNVKRLVRRWLKSLSGSSRKYSSRLRSPFSFFLLSNHELIEKFICIATGLPFGDVEVISPFYLGKPNMITIN